MDDAHSHAVGTAVLFENDRLRVWDLVLQPSEASAVHRHTADYVFVCTTPGRITFLAEGQPPTTTDYDDGFVQYTAVGPGITHQIRNVGEQVYREILIELKGPSVARSPQPSEDNGRSRPAPSS